MYKVSTPSVQTDVSNNSHGSWHNSRGKMCDPQSKRQSDVVKLPHSTQGSGWGATRGNCRRGGGRSGGRGRGAGRGEGGLGRGRVGEGEGEGERKEEGEVGDREGQKRRGTLTFQFGRKRGGEEEAGGRGSPPRWGGGWGCVQAGLHSMEESRHVRVAE